MQYPLSEEKQDGGPDCAPGPLACPPPTRWSGALKTLGLSFLLVLRAAVPLHGQDLDPAAVRVPLDSALALARKAATTAFPDLSRYLLYSVNPRVLKGDPGGLHWRVLWQERAFPHRRGLVARVYMSDGHVTTE